MSTPAPITEFPLEQEYEKKTGITREDIAKLRGWLETQPHLPGALITDLELVLSFHCCDRSAEVAKQVLDLHFTLRTLFTGLFKQRLVDQRAERGLNTLLTLPLQQRSRENYAALYIKIVDSDTKNFVFSDTMRSALMVLDLWQFEEGTWPGFLLLVDMEGVALGHLTRLDMHTLQHFFYYLQEATLLKLRGIHFINAPSFMDKVMMIIRPFMKKELLEMVVIHQAGSSTLDKHYPVAGLPQCAGGEYLAVDEARERIISRVRANAAWFAAESDKRVTESRRVGKPTTISDIFGGVEGSFKKLDID